MSLIEMLVVVGIIFVGVGIAAISMPTVLETIRADGAATEVEQQMRTARQYAIDHRRVVRLTLTAPNTITTAYRDWDKVNKTYVDPWPALGSDTLPSSMQFDAEPGLPNPGPDNLGNGKKAIDFNSKTDLYFWPDGSVQDAGITNGVMLSGVVYVAKPGRQMSTRAVTLFGPIGSVHVYKLMKGPVWAAR